MGIVGLVASGLIGLEHVYIMVLEMVLWNTPRGHKAFKLEPAYAEKTKTMAANQGLYNGFLAAGLFWSLIHPDPGFAHQLRLFFLGCVQVAGIYGGLTVGPKIFKVQGVPAAISLGLVLAGF